MCAQKWKDREDASFKKKVNFDAPEELLSEKLSSSEKFSPEGFAGPDLVAKTLKYFQDKYKDIACIILPQNFSDTSWENFSILWRIRKTKIELNVPPHVQNSIDICKKDPRRFLVLHLDIKKYHPKYSGHTNILIYDKDTNTVERFEPHGYKDSEKKLKPNLLNKALEKYFKEKWPGVKFVTPQELCHKCVGFQVLQASEQTSKLGFCVAWSLLYVNYRLQNPDQTPENLIRSISKDLQGTIWSICQP